MQEKRQKENWKKEKKIAEKAYYGLVSSSGKVPDEYNEFLFCREFHVLPHQLKDMSNVQYELYLEFMRQEGRASKVRNEREKQKAKLQSK